MGRKKDGVILLRCYKKDKEELREKAKQASMNMSEYIIALSENKKIIVAQGLPKLTLELKSELKNQIINIFSGVYSTVQLVQHYDTMVFK